MDIIRQFEGAMADGGPGAVARALVEACVNEVMSAQADAMCEETGASRNGFRERGLETQVGAITLRIPKLREGTCFPEGIVERRGRVDRAVICAASEMFAPSVSTRKVGKVLEKMRAARLSEDRVSRICFELDAEVSEPRGRDLSGLRFPYPCGWTPPTRRAGAAATAPQPRWPPPSPSPSARTESAGWSASPASTPSPTPAGRASCAGFASAASKGCGALPPTRTAASCAPCARPSPAPHRPSGARRRLGDPHAGRQGPARRLRRGGPGDGPRHVPGLARAHLPPVARRLGRRAGAPRLPGRAPPPHTHEQRAGAPEQGDKAQVEGGPELPLRGVARQARRGRALRGVVEPQVHGAVGHRGALGALRCAAPRPRGGAGRPRPIENHRARGA